MVLKTLKDLEVLYNGDPSGNIIYPNELKREAIKWAKYRNHKVDSDWCEFFNITEEDLL